MEKIPHRGRYNILNFRQKQQIIDYCKSNPSRISFIAKKMGTSKKNIERWINQGPYRQTGCGRKVRDASLDDKLVDWINR